MRASDYCGQMGLFRTGFRIISKSLGVFWRSWALKGKKQTNKKWFIYGTCSRIFIGIKLTNQTDKITLIDAIGKHCAKSAALEVSGDPLTSHHENDVPSRLNHYFEIFSFTSQISRNCFQWLSLWDSLGWLWELLVDLGIETNCLLN